LIKERNEMKAGYVDGMRGKPGKARDLEEGLRGKLQY
jgi:hypothetical protein